MNLNRLIASCAVAALLAGACGGDDPPDSQAETGASPDVTEEGAAVAIGRATWSTGYFQAAIYAALLEEIGYTVTDPAANEYPPADAYVAMAEGTIDFWPNGWYPQHDVWHDQELADGSTVGDHVVIIGAELEGAGLQGLVITKSVVEEHGIGSLAEINGDPALAALFDIDGNGIGDIFGCPEEWTCDDVIDEMITFNGWTNLQQVKAGYEGLVATSINRVNSGEPTIQYTWAPTGYLAQLIPGDNVLWLNFGGQENILDGSTASGLDYASKGPAPLTDTCTSAPCWLGWEVEDVLVTANRSFAEANPTAAGLFEVVKIDPADIAAQNARYDNGENSEDDIKRHAEEWVAENRAIVDEWIADALAAAG